jgi:hypothetical protein
MSDNSSYGATVPDNVTQPRELYSVVGLRGSAWSIQFAAAAPLRDHEPAGVLPGYSGPAQVYHRAEEPAEDVAVWTLPAGQVWLCVNPAFDGPDTLATIVKQLGVTEDGIAPRIQRHGELEALDVRDLHARDCVSYLSDGSSVPYSIRFLLSGGTGENSTINAGDIVIVNRTTPLGVMVACDGPPSAVAQLEATAAAVATSLVPLRPTVTGVNPNTGPKDGGTKVTITGTSFVGVKTVKFGENSAVSFTVVSERTIMAESPVDTRVWTGPPVRPVHVTVSTPGGESAASSADEFSYLWP